MERCGNFTLSHWRGWEQCGNFTLPHCSPTPHLPTSSPDYCFSSTDCTPPDPVFLYFLQIISSLPIGPAGGRFGGAQNSNLDLFSLQAGCHFPPSLWRCCRPLSGGAPNSNSSFPFPPSPWRCCRPALGGAPNSNSTFQFPPSPWRCCRPDIIPPQLLFFK